MKKRLLAVLVCISMVVGFASCAGNNSQDQKANNGTSSESSQGKKKTDKKKNVKVDDEHAFTFSCRRMDKDGKEIGNDTADFTSYKEGWGYPNLIFDCMAQDQKKDPSQSIVDAIASISGEDDEKDQDSGVRRVYAECASTTGYPIDGRTDKDGNPGDPADNPFRNASQAQDGYKMLKLCADHPLADKIKQNADQAVANENQQKQAQQELNVKRQSGEMIDPGTYAVGSQMQPGTWKTESEPVSNCYWEIRDQSGQIITNDFVVGAPSVTVDVPSSAGSFTSQNCSSWIKQ